MVFSVLFITSCSKELEHGVSLVNQHSQLGDPDLLEPAGLDIEFYRELFGTEYDDQPEGIAWRSSKKRGSKAKELKAEIAEKWDRLINLTNKSRNELKPYFDTVYYQSQVEFKLTFLFVKKANLTHLSYKQECSPDGSCSKIQKTSEDYTCDDKAIYLKIKDVDLWKGWGDIPRYSATTTFESFFGGDVEARRIISSNGELPNLRKLKLKSLVLDLIAKEYSRSKKLNTVPLAIGNPVTQRGGTNEEVVVWLEEYLDRYDDKIALELYLIKTHVQKLECSE